MAGPIVHCLLRACVVSVPRDSGDIRVCVSFASILLNLSETATPCLVANKRRTSVTVNYGSFLVPLCDFFLFVFSTLKLVKSTLKLVKSTLKLEKSTLMSIKSTLKLVKSTLKLV